MTVKVSIFFGHGRFVAGMATLEIEGPAVRVVQPSSVSFSAPKVPAKSERVIVDDLGVPSAGGHHSGGPSFWGWRI